MLALGKTVLNALAREGVFPVALRWWYDRNLHRRFPFPPHRRLHAQIIPFENYPVPNPGGFPLLLKPGDHKGCRCLLSYLLRGPDGRFLRREPTPERVPLGFRT